MVSRAAQLATCIVILASSWRMAAASMPAGTGSSRIKMFLTQTDTVGWDGTVKGTVLSISTRQGTDDQDLSGSLHDRSQATVRLHDKEGVTVGSELYIVNRDNLIVGKLAVQQVFYSRSFGTMLIGTGNFILVHDEDRVVQRADAAAAQYAYIHRARGEYYDSHGDTGNAISEYKKAIGMDPRYPEAHRALGDIYYRQNLAQFALAEYGIAYKNRGRIYDSEERFLLLRNMTEVCFSEYFQSYLPASRKKEFLEKGIVYGKEALVLFPDSVDVNYFLGMFHYRKGDDSDRVARDYFLKTIELDPGHLGSHVALAELYLKHRNAIKARMHAEAALKADPANRRARELIGYIDRNMVP